MSGKIKAILFALGAYGALALIGGLSGRAVGEIAANLWSEED